MNKTQMEIKLAEQYLSMTDHQRALLMEILELISGNPARRDFAAAWKGRPEDLPAALAEI